MPGAKSGCGSLRLRRHWLPQPAAQAAAAGGDDDAGGRLLCLAARSGFRKPAAGVATSRRATCCSQRPQPPAAGVSLQHAALLLRAPPCRVRVAAGFPRCCCSLAPRRSKETPKTGDHGGIVRQPERDRSLLTATAYSMRLGKVIARFARRRRPQCFMRTLRRREPGSAMAHCC